MQMQSVAGPCRVRAFTLTEMLVVLGIIILIVSLLMPAVMRARRQSRNAACVSNMHQIGQMIIMYADANRDYVTFGISGLAENREPGVEFSDATYRLSSSYPIVVGHPSAGLGSLFANGMLSEENGKILYCPTDPDERLTFARFRDRFPARNRPPAPNATVRISYFCRPVNRLFRHTLLPAPAVYWPKLLTRFTDLQGCAILCENFAAPHGTTGAPRFNVLYQDGSVRAIASAGVDFNSLGGHLHDTLPPPGFVPARNPAPNLSIGSDGATGWGTIDAQYEK